MRTLYTFSCAIIIFMLGTSNLSAQKVEKKFMKELCKCAERLDPGESNDELKRNVTDCAQQTSDANLDELIAQLKADRSFKEMGEYIEYLMLETSKECPVFREYFIKLEFEDRNTEDRSGMKHDVPEECLITHEGTFYYTGKDSVAEVYITRKGDIQIEGVIGTDEYVLSKIEWLDECTYVSTFQETNDPQAKAFFKKGQQITVNITHVDGDRFGYYTVISGAKVNGDMRKVSDEFMDPREE